MPKPDATVPDDCCCSTAAYTAAGWEQNWAIDWICRSASHWAIELSGVPYSYLWLWQYSAFLGMDWLPRPLSQQKHCFWLGCLCFSFKQGSRFFSPPALLAYLVRWLTKQPEYREEGCKCPLHTLISLVPATKLVRVLCVRWRGDSLVRLSLQVKPYLESSPCQRCGCRRWHGASQHLGQRPPHPPPLTLPPASHPCVQMHKASGQPGHGRWTAPSNFCLWTRTEKRLSSLTGGIGKILSGIISFFFFLRREFKFYSLQQEFASHS